MLAWVLFLGAGVGVVGVHAAWTRAPAGDPGTGLLWLGLAALPYLLALALLPRVSSRPAPAVLWAFLVAAAALMMHLEAPARFSSEMGRYRWDGRVAVAGYNPYEFAPDHPEMAPFRAELGGSPPRPDRPGYFPPLAEFAFYALSRLGRDDPRDYRVVASGLLLLGGLAFLLLSGAARAPAAGVLILLWHPLLLVETASHARLVAPAVFLLLVSLLLLARGHHLSPSGFLGLAALTQILPAALLPVYLRRVPVYRFLVFFLVVLLGTLPFVGAGRQLWNTLWDFTAGARWNPGGFLLLERGAALIGHREWARYGSAFVALGLAVLVAAIDDKSPRALARGAVLLCALPALAGPYVEPWTGLWTLPLLALLPGLDALRWPFLYLSGSLALSYLGHPDGRLPAWVPIAEYAPLPVLAVAGWWHDRKH